MKYILYYKLIYIILVSSHLVRQSIPHPKYGIEDFSITLIAIAVPILIINLYNIWQIKQKTVNKWVFLIEQIMSISRMAMVTLIAIRIGTFLMVFSPVYSSLWGPMGKVLESPGEVSFGTAAVYYIFIVTLFFLEYSYFVLLKLHKEGLSRGRVSS